MLFHHILSRLRKGGSHREPVSRFAPPGHFYSPIPDPTALDGFVAPRPRPDGLDLPGIDLRVEEQRGLLARLAPTFSTFATRYSPPRAPGRRFSLNQNFFLWADAMALRALLHLRQPGRIVEVGSGHSSALMLDAAEEIPGYSPEFTFIEPYPERLLSTLRPEDRARCTLIQSGVQSVAMNVFTQLRAGDLLFIDSSHVSKAASDVNFLFHEVVPRLAPGVIIHVHDIFWPFEYPAEWLREGRAWNEAYLLRALLCGNRQLRILFWGNHLATLDPEWFHQNAPDFLRNTGGSIYLETTD